jgi:MoaA/NifB/PqqE/SkfB family radical SAM enzyme
MNIPHPKFCVLPWISLETSPIGTVRPCCLADHEIQDESGHKINLKHTDFEVIRNTQHMKLLRQQFLDGQQPETCRRCWAEEDSGRTSKRMHTLERLKNMVPDESWTADAKPLMFLDLKLGNICNLKCRICGSWSSSTYAAEEIRYQSDRKNNFHYEMMKLGRWPREESKFWHDLAANMHNIRYLEFTGGEPFMIQEHFDVLEKIVKAGYAHQIEIHYNTNGTIFPAEAESIWAQFRHVEIAFSIDDIGPRFEYQRSGALWTEVNANISEFRAMRSRHSNISLQVCSTVNAFNVLYLETLAQWIDQQQFDYVFWNMLHDGPQFCIANLNRDTKDLAIDRLRRAQVSQFHRLEFDKIIEFMQQGSDTDASDLKASIRKTDQRRNENLNHVLPDLARALHYEA